MLHGARTRLVRSGSRISAAISAWLTASHPNSEVKQVRAGVVLRWGTTREGPVLRFSRVIPPSFLLLASPFRPALSAVTPDARRSGAAYRPAEPGLPPPPPA